MSLARIKAAALVVLVAALVPGAAEATYSVRGPSLEATAEPREKIKPELDDEGQRLLDSISNLRRPEADAPDKQEANDLRLTTLKSEALSFGMRSGLAWRYRRIEGLLRERGPQLDSIFAFNQVLYNEVALPPVVSVIEDGFRVMDSDTARVTRVGYRIEHPARLVMMAPTWRDFLMKRYPEPEQPSWVILPKNGDEAEAWKAGIATGWAKGVGQADLIYEASLALLTRTFLGMLTFRELVATGLVSPPVVAKTDRRVVLEGRQLNIGDVLYRLSEQPTFQTPEHWMPGLKQDYQAPKPGSGQ